MRTDRPHTRRQFLECAGAASLLVLVGRRLPALADPADIRQGVPSMPYSETMEQQNPLLARRFAEAEQYLERVADQAEAERRQAWAIPSNTSPGAHSRRMEGMRGRVRRMLGYPPPGRLLHAKPEIKELGGDDDGTFFRVTLPLLAEGFTVYGLLIRPRQPVPGRTLAVAIHGGGGTPELAAEILGPTNYGNMGRRLARRGHTVWMPACLERTTFDEKAPPRDVHRILDLRARVVGTTLPAIDAFAIIQSTRTMLAAEHLTRLGALAIGLSYGGMRSLLVSALSTLYRGCVSSCMLQDKREFFTFWSESGGFSDMFWRDCLRQATEVELAALVAPRPLFIELGRNDDLVPPARAKRSLAQMRAIYRRLGIPARFGSDIFAGGHEFSGVKALEFLDRVGL